MKLNWQNIEDIAEALNEKYSEFTSEDIKYIKFTDLYKYICSLDNFIGDKANCNEKKLEAIQGAWLEEKLFDEE